MDALLHEPSPSWLTDRRAHLPPAEGWMEPLMDEQGITGSLAAQIGLLYERYPDALAHVMRRARSSMVA